MSIVNDTAIDNLTQLLTGARALVQLTRRMEEMNLTEPKSGQLVVDGKTLHHILGDSDAEQRLAKLASGCGAVCVCRATPSQKANIVNMMRRWELHIAQLGITFGPLRWLARSNRNLQVRVLFFFFGGDFSTCFFFHVLATIAACRCAHLSSWCCHRRIIYLHA